MSAKEIIDMFETLTKQWGDTDNYVNDLLSYSKSLQQENKQLKEELSIMVKDDEKSQETIIKLGKKISKAIEFIKDNACYDGEKCKCSFSSIALDKLLEILKGE